MTLFSKHFDLIVKINCYILNSFSMYTLVESDENVIFPFEEAKFDAVVYQHNKKDGTKSLSDVMSFLKEGGACVYFTKNTDNVDDVFYECKVPLMLDINDNEIAFVCKNSDDEKGIVPYGYFFDDGYGFTRQNVYLDIKNKRTDINDYQILTKVDFKVAVNDIRFHCVCHPKGQEHFVWKKISDVISLDKEGEWVYNTDFDEKLMHDQKALSKDPFKINAPNSFYLDNYENKPSNHHPLNDFPIKRQENGSFGRNMNEKYVDIFKKTFVLDTPKDAETDKFAKMLCGRILYKPTLLYSYTYGGVLRVKPSKEHPFCYSPYTFYQGPYDEGGYIECDYLMCPIKINPDYDENFVIFQLLKSGVRKGYILVAPSKEEQHTYFLSKRRDYIAQFMPALDEVEDSLKQRISSLSSRIRGMGFENFRRFKSLSEMPLGGVNILVGANNAGKSTFVKGLLLAIDNLKNLQVEYPNNIFETVEPPLFHLDSNNYADVHIGNFDRAFSWTPLENMVRKEITFNLAIANYEISFSIIQGEDTNTSSVPISRILVKDTKRDASFDIDYLKKTAHVVIAAAGNKLEYDTQLSITVDRLGYLLIPQLIRGIAVDAENKKESEYEGASRLRVWSGFIYEIAEELEGIINNLTVEYIYAHGVSQRALFDYNDRNDYMALTLHDLVNEKIGEEEKNFVNKWLKEFGIGHGYKVESVVGESYILKIQNKDGHDTYLADMGMGTNQLVTLLFRLAIFIHKQRYRKESPYKPMIVIEEPEQNMHPAFQSKLADLLFEVNRDYGFSFIVETHSEYLVRRSQVIVAGQNYKDEKELNEKNPFKVYYFPSDKNPYDMKFRTDGNFSEEFGPGFYDEATNLLFQII